MECENPNHEGENPPILKDEKGWWFKDPEWQHWCPRCRKKWFQDIMKDEISKSKTLLSQPSDEGIITAYYEK